MKLAADVSAPKASKAPLTDDVKGCSCRHVTNSQNYSVRSMNLKGGAGVDTLGGDTLANDNLTGKATATTRYGLKPKVLRPVVATRLTAATAAATRLTAVLATIRLPAVRPAPTILTWRSRQRWRRWLCESKPRDDSTTVVEDA